SSSCISPVLTFGFMSRSSAPSLQLRRDLPERHADCRRGGRSTGNFARRPPNGSHRYAGRPHSERPLASPTSSCTPRDEAVRPDPPGATLLTPGRQSQPASAFVAEEKRAPPATWLPCQRFATPRPASLVTRRAGAH